MFLDEEDWNDVTIACSSLADKWQQLCAYLGLSIKTIRTIRGNYPNDSAAAWNEALTLWVLQDYNTRRHGMPSWMTLLKAISKVDQPLFEKLAKEHQTLGMYVCIVSMRMLISVIKSFLLPYMEDCMGCLWFVVMGNTTAYI